jgi:hypothetical protein
VEFGRIELRLDPFEPGPFMPRVFARVVSKFGPVAPLRDADSVRLNGSGYRSLCPLLRLRVHSFRLHSAIEDHSIRMHLLHKKPSSMVRNQMIYPLCKVVVERDHLARGFELLKGNYVQITERSLNRSN